MFTPADMDVYHSAHIECNSCRIAGLAVGWVTRFVDGSKTCDRSRLIESKYVSAGDSGINGEGMVAGSRRSSTVPTRDIYFRFATRFSYQMTLLLSKPATRISKSPSPSMSTSRMS